MIQQQKVGIIGILICAVLAFLIVQYGISVVLGAVILFGLLALAVAWPEAATLIVIFVLYTNVAVVAKFVHGVPHLVASSFSLLLVVPLASYLVVKREKVIIDQPLLLIFGFLAVVLASSLFAKDMNIAIDWIIDFLLEGVALYLLIINVVRKLATLRRVVWVLMLAGSLLGALTLYQELTQSYDQTFGGLAQRGWRTMAEAEKEQVKEEQDMFFRTDTDWHRAKGPIGDANRYAQIMIMLLPLVLFQLWGARSWWLRGSAVAALVPILGGLLLTYSRGAFVTLILLLLIMTFMRYIRPHQIVVSATGLALLMAAVAPGYLVRMDSLRGVEGLFSQGANNKPDAVTRGRTTEMLAAVDAFVDHPILGVGPGQYTPLYSMDYQLNLPNALRYLPKNRRAHSLYPELAAETGIIGLAFFMAIVLVIMYRLWQARRLCMETRPDLANMATAFLLSIVAYLGTAIFLQLSYQRYFWLMLALAGATIRICNSEMQSKDEYKEGPLKRPIVTDQTTM